MKTKYYFNIIFEKLEEAKQDQNINNVATQLFEEIDENIRTLREFIADSEEKIIFTRSS